MFCCAYSPMRLLGSILAVCAAALFVMSAPDQAYAGKIVRSFSKGHGNAPSSGGAATPSGAHKQTEHPGTDSGSAAKHQSAEDASSGKHEASDDTSGTGIGLRPSVGMKSEDASPKNSSPENAATDPAPAPAQAAAAPAPAPASTKKKKTVKVKEPHPLAAPHKGMDVTVCEAGCANEKQQVVYSQPTTATKDAGTSEMQPSSSNSAAATAKDMIVCMGGCYDTPKSYASTLVAAAPSEVVKGSLKPTNARSGDWMRRIDKSRGEKATN